MYKKILLINLILLCTWANVYAANRDGFTIGTEIFINGEKNEELNDNNYSTSIDINKGDTIELISPEYIKNVYIIYSLYSAEGELKITKSDNSFNKNGSLHDLDDKTSSKVSIGKNGYLHELVELDETTNRIELTYNKNVTIKEIFVFKGSTPSWVEKWEKPYEDADILIFSTHNDDDIIFFAGLEPKMIDEGKKLQVVYTVIHHTRPIRMDELLEGLWSMKIKNYPVIGSVPDAWSTSYSGGIKNLEKYNMTLDDVIRFEVNMIRRFKPEVVVSHDENGEYGHGQHRITTRALEESIKYLGDKNYKSDYKPFVPYKIYLHLYEKNPIVMDIDSPLKAYNGKTAFRVCMDAFKLHKTQKYSEWAKWIPLENSGKIAQYSPRYYGLYYSTVGYENKDDDMFYNIPGPKEQELDNDKIDKEEKEAEEKKEYEKKVENLQDTTKSVMITIFIVLIILDIGAFLVKRTN